MAIAQNIRTFRKKRGLSREQLGQMIGMTGGAIGSYERGITIPKRRTVEKIAHALGVSTEKIMKDTVAPINSGEHQESRTNDILLYDGVLTFLKELYGMVEGRMVVGENGNCKKYYIIHHSTGSFVLYEKDIAAIVHSAKASLRPMAEYMKNVHSSTMFGAGNSV